MKRAMIVALALVGASGCGVGFHDKPKTDAQKIDIFRGITEGPATPEFCDALYEMASMTLAEARGLGLDENDHFVFTLSARERIEADC